MTITRISDEAIQLDVTNADLSRSMIRDANLADSVLEDVNMSGVVIRDVNLSGASIEDARLDGFRVEGIAVTDLLAFWRAGHKGDGNA